VSASCPAPALSRFLGAGPHLSQLSHFRGPAQTAHSASCRFLIPRSYVQRIIGQRRTLGPSGGGVLGNVGLRSFGQNIPGMGYADRVRHPSISNSPLFRTSTCQPATVAREPVEPQASYGSTHRSIKTRTRLRNATRSVSRRPLDQTATVAASLELTFFTSSVRRPG
jgi:hypothetical protein